MIFNEVFLFYIIQIGKYYLEDVGYANATLVMQMHQVFWLHIV